MLDIDEEKYLQDLILANSQAFALAEKIGFISKENVKILLQKDYLLTLNIGKRLNINICRDPKDNKFIECCTCPR